MSALPPLSTANRILALALLFPVFAFAVVYACYLAAGPHGFPLPPPGWHVIGGVLYHDGAADREGTDRMMGEIAAIAARQDAVDAEVDGWALRRKEAYGSEFDAQRAAVYRKYEHDGDARR